MLESIREIGLFMIAAQAVIHFAPGRQYEKYIKLISSVIILLLFVRSFVSGQGELEQGWKTGMEQIIQKYEDEDIWQESGRSADDMAVEQLEQEIKIRFNDALSDGSYMVDTVSLLFENSLDKEGSEQLQVQKVEVVMIPRKKETITPVLVENIIIGEGNGQTNGEMTLQYQEMFAGILGIEPDRVEVTCVGGW